MLLSITQMDVPVTRLQFSGFKSDTPDNLQCCLPLLFVPHDSS